MTDRALTARALTHPFGRVAAAAAAVSVVVLGGVALTAPSAAGAAAAAGPATTSPTTSELVGLSLDGRTWTGRLDRPLFDPALRWVPGDVHTARLWVRNQGPDRGDVSLRVRSDAAGQAAAPALLDAVRDGALDVAARTSGGQWQRPTDRGLLAAASLDPGDAVPLDVRVALRGDSAPDMAAVGHLGFDVTVASTRSGAVADLTQATSAQVELAMPRWRALCAAVLAASAALGLLRAPRRRARPHRRVNEVAVR